MEAKFKYGDKVVINGNIVGIVLFSYNMFSPPHEPCFVYRIIVDAHELCHRVNNYTQVNQVGDQELLAEDLKSLFVDTQQLAVMELLERELTLFEYDYESN